MNYYVYALVYPDGRYFYIGKGIGDRDRRHLKYSVHNEHVRHVVAKIRSSGQEPVVIRLKENLTNEEACVEEIKLIAEYGMRTNGGLLCNLHPGGNGGRPSSVWTESSKAKLRARMTGRKWSDESKAKMSASMMGNKRLLGYVHSEETRRRISEVGKGRVLSEEARKNISDAKKGANNPMFGKPSPRRGVTLSEETKQKLRDAAKRRYAK